MKSNLDEEDTRPGMDIQQAILQELQHVSQGITCLSGRMQSLEARVEQVVIDLNTVHALQRTYTGRLAIIEQMLVDRPLVTAKQTPLLSPKDGDGRLEP